MKNFFRVLGEHIFFFVEVATSPIMKGFEFNEFLGHLSRTAWRSIPTTITAGIFTGAILAMQFYLQLRDFGAENVLGGLNTSGTLREVGPVLIAFMLAGKVGAYTSAEIGSMKITDQVEAIRCLGVDPLRYLIAPRFFAVSISSVLLLSVGLIISVLGGMIAAYFVGGINFQQYLLMIPRFASLQSIFLAVSKSFVFGMLMGHICCANGYWTEGGTQGVGRAVKNTSVQSMVSIVMADFIMSWTAEGFLFTNGH